VNCDLEGSESFRTYQAKGFSTPVINAVLRLSRYATSLTDLLGGKRILGSDLMMARDNRLEAVSYTREIG
jgi:hypothetical protein